MVQPTLKTWRPNLQEKQREEEDELQSYSESTEAEAVHQPHSPEKAQSPWRTGDHQPRTPKDLKPNQKEKMEEEPRSELHQSY